MPRPADWLFTYHYLIAYAGRSPFSRHDALEDAQGQADLLADLMRWTPTSAGP